MRLVALFTQPLYAYIAFLASSRLSLDQAGGLEQNTTMSPCVTCFGYCYYYLRMNEWILKPLMYNWSEASTLPVVLWVVFCVTLHVYIWLCCLHVGLSEVKQHESRLTEISAFDKEKLAHAETKEKVVLPDPSGRSLTCSWYWSNKCDCL